MTDFDVAIIGGGPSGSILGMLLAEAGYETAIFDRDTFPRNKLCGEFIAPDGRRVLSKLDLIETLKGAGGSSIPHYEITTRDNETLTDTFETPGFALSRHRLDILLLGEAQAAGANVYTTSRITDVEKKSSGQETPCHKFHVNSSSKHGYPEATGSAHLLLGAYGRRSSLDRKLDRPFFQNSYGYVGFQKHHRVPANASLESDRVKLYLIPGGYCGVVRIEKDLVNVCLMVHTSSLPEGSTNWSAIRDTLLSTNPSLHRQLRRLAPAEDGCRSVAQIPLMDKDTVRDPVLFTGDASGMVAPLTGSGQAMAIRSGQKLADLISSHGLPENRSQFRDLGERWSTVWASSFSNQIRAGGIVNTLLQYNPVTSLAVKLLKRTPGFSTYLRKRVTSC